MLSSRITVSILSVALGLMSVSAPAAPVGGVGVISPPAAVSPATSDVPATLDQLSDPDSQFYDGSREQGEEGGIRQRTLEEAARGVGIRGGYADEARRINDALERQFAPRLNRRFTFSSIMLREGTVVPPVVTLMTSVEETSGDSFLYTSVGAYEIVKDARVAIKTPTWREYLTLPVTDPSAPQGLSPKTSAERDLWTKAVKEGWKRGIQEAREEFIASLDRLIRDYDGMVRYRDLQAQGILSAPSVTNRSIGYRATADGRRAFVDEKAIRITVMPKFKGRVPKGAGRP
jgi:defect-in-organelle-trafficking protein DotC